MPLVALEEQPPLRLHLMDKYHQCYLQPFCSPESQVCAQLGSTTSIPVYRNMTLGLFTAPETSWFPTVNGEDSDSGAPTSRTQESLADAAEIHSRSVDYRRHVLPCMSSKLSGQVDAAFEDHTSKAKVERTMLWWWIDGSFWVSWRVTLEPFLLLSFASPIKLFIFGCEPSF